MNSLGAINYICDEQKKYLATLVSRIKSFYGPSLVSLAVFGSMARGENKTNSDCDLFIVLEDQPKRSHRQKIKEFVGLELSLIDLEQQMENQGVIMEISPIILSRSQASGFNPLYLDMTEQVIILHDLDQFLKSILEKTRLKMSKWRSQKLFVANGWYWDIKPDLQWGEVIDYDQ